jgi:hypothetical protein
MVNKGSLRLFVDLTYNTTNIESYVNSPQWSTAHNVELRVGKVNSGGIIGWGTPVTFPSDGSYESSSTAIQISQQIPITFEDVLLNLVDTVTGNIIESRSLVNGTITGGVL